nr:hypothetical protein [Tanacetum cinerariifolium]
MAPLPPRDQRHLWLRYQVEGYTEGIVHDFEQRLEMIFSREVNRVYILDFEGLTLEIRRDLAMRLRMVYIRGDGQLVFVSHTWRSLFGIQVPLVHEFILEFLSTCRMSDTEMGLDEMAEAGFRAYWDGSDRVILDKGGLRDYLTEISSGRDFLGPAPSYVLILDPVRRLCHKIISYSFFSKGMHLRRQAKGRKSRAKLLGGHFIRHLAAHFRLVSDEGLRGLQVVTCELQLVYLHELGSLNICLRIEEEMRNLRQSVVGLRGVVESSITEQTRVSTWMITRMTQFMDASRHTYQPFDSTLIGSS